MTPPLTAQEDIAREQRAAMLRLFMIIAAVLEEALSEHTGTELEDADVVIEVDRRARERTRSIIERRAAA